MIKMEEMQKNSL